MFNIEIELNMSTFRKIFISLPGAQTAGQDNEKLSGKPLGRHGDIIDLT
jgi:hypothetical protein